MALDYTRPDWVRRLNYFADAVGGADHMVSLDQDELIELAVKTTGLDDFGDDTWREPYNRLMASVNSEANLHVVGRLMTRGEILRCLRTRLWLVEQHKVHPETSQRSIDRPVFICGASRTGTTILHELLAQDPALRAPLAWETLHPFDRPEMHDDQGKDMRADIAECEQELWEDIQPEFASIHELRSRLPMECLTLMAPEFSIGYWATVLDVPEFLMWRAASDPLPGYRFHKFFLQALQPANQAERWVLKSPVHMGYFQQLFQVYPDARVIHTHRDPIKILPSTVSTTYTTRFIRTDKVNFEELAAGVAFGFQMQLTQTMEERKTGQVPDDQIADLHFRNLMQDPVGTIAAVYQRLDLEFTDSFADKIEQYLAAKPKGKHGAHSYSPEDWGFSAVEIRQNFKSYTDYYSIEYEA